MPSYNKEVKIPGKSKKEIYEKVASTLEKFLEKFPLGKHEIDYDPSKYLVEVSSSQFSAKITCSEGGFKLDGKLSLLATPFRGKIDEGVDHWVKKHFHG